MSVQDLAFMKRLLDNVEYANEEGVLNVIKLLTHPDPDVTQGTGFAIGAFATTEKLLAMRPELFTERVNQEFQVLSQDSHDQIHTFAKSIIQLYDILDSGKRSSSDAARPSSTQTMECQGQTLEAARHDLQEKLTPGSVVIRETVLNDGSFKNVEAEGKTVQDAIQKAKAELPVKATIEKQDVLEQPTRDIIRIFAFDESEARRKAVAAQPKWIESLSATKCGRKGFLGIGRRPNAYNIVIIQPAHIRIIYREPARIRVDVGTLVDKYSQQLSHLSDDECAAIIRGKDATEVAAIMEALKRYSGKVQPQTLLAAIDHLANGLDTSRQLAMQFLIAKDSMPSTALKIAYELRERALQEDEITMPLSQVVDEFRKTPAWGTRRAQSVLEFVRKFFEQSPEGRDQFEERFTYFSRSAPLVTEGEYLSRGKNRLLCRGCGQPMAKHPQGTYVKLRCERCNITRFEMAGDV